MNVIIFTSKHSNVYSNVSPLKTLLSAHKSILVMNHVLNHH